MADSNNTAKLSALGVKVEEFHWGEIFKGSEAALVASGLVQSEWLPGKPGNNKTSNVVVFEDGKTRVLVGMGRSTGDHISIKRLAKDRYEVYKDYSEAEIESRNLKEAWKLAKLARERDYLAEWKTNVIALTNNIEELAEGKRVFTGYPEIKLSSYSLEKVRNAIANLTLAIEEAKPYSADIEAKSNVISIRGEAYRHFQQT